jgi:hypothetical protein
VPVYHRLGVGIFAPCPSPASWHRLVLLARLDQTVSQSAKFDGVTPLQCSVLNAQRATHGVQRAFLDLTP